MSEIHGHFSLERDGIMYIQLAARPGDEVRGLVADHGQEFDQEVRRGGPSAVYRAGHLVRGARPAGASPGSLLAAFSAASGLVDDPTGQFDGSAS